MKRRIIFGNEEMEKLWHQRDSKTFSQNDAMSLSSKNSNQITLKEFNCFIVTEISTDISKMLKKSLPNKIVSVFGHQNWSVLIYLS